jgi:hypothetical protein
MFFVLCTGDMFRLLEPRLPEATVRQTAARKRQGEKRKKKGKGDQSCESRGLVEILPGARGTWPGRGVIALVHIFTRPEALWVFALVNWAVSSHPLQSVAADDTPISVGLMGPQLCE